MMETSIPDFSRPVEDQSVRSDMYGDQLTQLSMIVDQLRVHNDHNSPTEKLDKAFDACLENRVAPTATLGLYRVSSHGSEEGVYETHDGVCTCPHATYSGTERYHCYHATAAVLYARWQQAMRPLGVPLQPLPNVYPAARAAVEQECAMNAVAQGPGEAKPFPTGVMTEAPYSCTVSVENAQGYSMLLTVRKPTGAEFFPAVTKMLAWCVEQGYLPQHRGGPRGEVVETAAPTAPTCLQHGPMKPSDKVPGTFYCSKKLADGTYCKERSPKAA
jgi:hypothetical protein